jgi:cardiolipin synthase
VRAELSELELLVGAATFWERAARDIDRARRRVLVQAMTFEGDAAGQAVAGAILASRAADRRVLVDDYTRWVVSDRWVGGRRETLPPDLRDEVDATHVMFLGLMRSGVRVRRTNPIGRLFANYPARNHKKLIVADDVAYIGGINFSDHNFAWRDFMVRIDGAEAANWLANDFDATFAGQPLAARTDLSGVSLWSLNGRDNSRAFDDLMAMITAARDEITVVSPYLTFPITGALARAARSGVKVRLITPGPSNKPTVRDHLLATARAAGFDIFLLGEMIHLKGLLIDGRQLVVGSSNFDFVSLAAEEELIAVIDDAAIIAEFEAQIVEPAIASAAGTSVADAPFAAGWLATGALRVAQLVALSARRARRTAVDWT